MLHTPIPVQSNQLPKPAAVLELFKPVTWFAAMWAFMCGAVSSGQPFFGNMHLLLGGMLLAGPMVCASSQAVNDWYDRHVDAINEPNRPIPSGRIPGRWGLYLAIIWSGLSLLLGLALGVWAFAATLVGVFFAWAYSAPPLRLKLNGWWGNAAVGISYEGISWFTGAAVMLGAFPHPLIIFLALAYSVGAHGIMTLNDFKSIEGDRLMGVRSLPAQLGPDRAALVACVIMGVSQVAVIFMLAWIGKPFHAVAIIGLLCAQLLLMNDLLSDPRGKAIWYSATGVTLFVLGMLVSAFAVQPWSVAG
ncbi:MAG: bacteriochlorophyll/chlorophyll a synthase [Hyphomonas sp.]|uniref:chlorophyll synthase ChlG n=1 Tax=Hyphomonas sp. TaxID=87 RepID=UPI0025B854E7|nr:chlorophyll synthase ChlG [Hyphomonas sp.]MBA4339321.1 bacteriochlorophyll/chlorophyll a synthase [Hyphomonas sp.]